MAVATGTALAIGAGLSAAGALGGAALSSRAQGRATEASLEAGREALAYQREQDALEREMAQQHLAQTIAARNALLERYGVSFRYPETPLGTSTPQPGTAVPRGRAPIRRGAGLTVGEIIPATGGGTPWHDWATYGLRR